MRVFYSIIVLLAFTLAACTPQMAEMPSRSIRVVVDADARDAFAQSLLDFTRDHGYRLNFGGGARQESGLVVDFHFFTGELHVRGGNHFEPDEFGIALYRVEGAKTPSETEIDRFHRRFICAFIHIPGVAVYQREVGIASEGVRIPPEDYEGCTTERER